MSEISSFITFFTFLFVIFVYSGKDSCSGDSGGPLMIKRHKRLDTHMTQIGVVSWGLDQCGNEGVPGIYTNVRYFLSWILDHLD